MEGLESARPTATGSLAVYIATDSKKIWFDQGASNWIQIGGQDTIAWGNVTGKPTTYTPPTASPTVLGGIKVGANLTIDANGVLNSNDNPTSYLIKQEKFTATEGQIVFNLTKGQYRTGLGALSVFIYGSKLSNDAFTESSTTRFTLKTGLSAGDVVLVEYIQLINVEPYPIHASEHLTGGADPIPLATTTADGLMSSTDKTKINNSYTSVQVNNAISTAINNLVNGAPGALDTLIELASAMGNDPNFATTMTNALANKVDKITGKGLSTEDFTTALLAKLNGIANGAEVNQNTFANVKVGTTTIVADSKSDTLEMTAGSNVTLAPDATNDKVTISSQDTITTINGKTGAISKADIVALGIPGQDTNTTYGVVTASVNGLMSSVDKSKLDGVATGANNYTHPANHPISLITGLQGALDSKVDNSRVLTDVPVGAKFTDTVYSHPASHPASMITESTTKRFVTDTEKATWDGKTGKYSTNVGTGSATSITVTHNLNSMDVVVSLREVASPYNAVMTDWQVINVNSVRLIFAAAPSLNQYRVVVVG